MLKFDCKTSSIKQVDSTLQCSGESGHFLFAKKCAVRSSQIGRQMDVSELNVEITSRIDNSLGSNYSGRELDISFKLSSLHDISYIICSHPRICNANVLRKKFILAQCMHIYGIRLWSAVLTIVMILFI